MEMDCGEDSSSSIRNYEKLTSASGDGGWLADADSNIGLGIDDDETGDLALNPVNIHRRETAHEFEAGPHADFYDGKSPTKRPSMADLLEKGENYGTVDEPLKNLLERVQPSSQVGYKFGWIEGVFIRCTLSIFGVVMFLRLNWVMAQAGLGGGLMVIIYSTTVTGITTTSLSAISTNGRLPAGGIYYMVSRQLGSDIGVVVGATLFIAQSFAVAMNLVGVAESVVNLQSEYMIDKEWDGKIFALIGLLLVLFVAFNGAQLEIHLQKFLFFVMSLALLNFFIGVLVQKKDDDFGSTGISSKSLNDNSDPNYSSGESWVTVFGVFFPAVTGIVAGSSISGDLANPSEAIPKGTFLAVAVTTFVYLLMAVLLAASFNPEGLANISTQIDAIDISLIPAIGTAGIFAAGLSSALALIVGAPRVLMALARDDLLEVLEPLKKGYTAKDEPLRGYVFVLIIAILAILFLDLNAVNPIVTNFYLLQYCVVNYAVASAEFSKTPGWRPSFKYYHAYLSVLGCILCAASMFMVDYITAFVTFVVAAFLFNYVRYFRQPDVNWGESSQAARHMKAVRAMYELEDTKAHVKNFRPQYLVLTGDLRKSPDLVIAMQLLRKSHGVMIAGHVIPGNIQDDHDEYMRVLNSNTLKDLNVKGFNSVVMSPNLLNGVHALLQISGLGKLRANTVVIGFKRSWRQASEESNVEYIEIIRSCMVTKHGVAVVRNLTIDYRVVDNSTRTTIDVWWLVEDGGLTLLIAYLLSRHQVFRSRNTVLRVFSVAEPEDIYSEKSRLQSLMDLFRIDALVQVVSNMDIDVSNSTKLQFKEYSSLSEDEIERSSRITYFMKLSEQMKIHSGAASLVVASLPVPRMRVPTKEYFAYLEMLTDGRPTFLIRGNQETVLTYYS